jgi:hypothetical protein
MKEKKIRECGKIYYRCGMCESVYAKRIKAHECCKRRKKKKKNGDDKKRKIKIKKVRISTKNVNRSNRLHGRKKKARI